MKIDVQAVAKGALDDARVLLEPEAKRLGERGAVLVRRLAAIEADVRATLSALESSTSELEAAALREDLEATLPARRRILLAAVEAELGSSAKATLDAALEVGLRVALVLARAFIPIP